MPNDMQQQPTDAAPDTGALDTRDLDRTIAERLGWHPEQLGEGWRWRNGDSKWTAPTGRNGSAEDVFNYLHSRQGLFNYSTDMNVAVELLKLMPLGGLAIDEDGATWIANAFLDGAGVVADAEADTPALAICRAWLAYTAA